MNILYINHSPYTGGAETVLYNTVKELSKNKDNNIFVLMNENKSGQYKRMSSLNVKMIVKDFYLWGYVDTSFKNRIHQTVSWFLKRKWVNLKTAIQVSKIVKNNNIEIIHTNTSVLGIGGLISVFSGAKHIWHIHEYFDLGLNFRFFEGKFLSFTFMNLFTDKFIFVSNSLASYYKRISTKKKIVVYNGINCSNNIKEINNNDRKKILIAGSISKQKGQDEAVKAATCLYDMGFTNFDLYIAGGDKLWFDIPKKLKENIHILGWVNNLDEFRKEIDIELVCSINEAFGLVTIEAMNMGNCVVASDCEATKEIITNTIDGYIYKKGDYTELANIILSLLNNDEKRILVGKKAQETIYNKFSFEKYIDNIVETYKNVLEN